MIFICHYCPITVSVIVTRFAIDMHANGNFRLLTINFLFGRYHQGLLNRFKNIFRI